MGFVRPAAAGPDRAQQSTMAPHSRTDPDLPPVPLSPSAAGARLRLFFGGSFDPPHLGHALLPPQMLEKLGIEPARLIYVPAARSPHKLESPAADEHRLNMLGIALQDRGGWEIWTQELRDAGLKPGEPSYWADTWAILRQMELPGESMFLIGTDQALSMHRWHRYGEFWRDAVVMLREGVEDGAAMVDGLARLDVWSEKDLDHWRERVVSIPTIAASSTAIRAALADPERRKNPIAGLDERVHKYILDNGLYR